MRSGSTIFARVSWPSRQRNADRVYSAECLPRLRDLNFGYRARLLQNATNALCKCRRHCCSGTEDTSFKNASSGSRFHLVSSAEDSEYDTRRCSSRQAALRASSARL
jgi:hypothetical protein